MLKQSDIGAAAGRVGAEVLGEVSEQLANRAIAQGYINADEKDEYKLRVQRQMQDPTAMEAEHYRKTRPISAPVTPGELGSTIGVSTGSMWAFPRIAKLFGKTTSKMPTVGKSFTSGFGPAMLPMTALFEGLNIAALNPLNDPVRRAGQRGYLESVSEGLGGAMDTLQTRGREARRKHPVLGVPIQMFHGIMNPVTSSALALRNMKRAITGEPAEKAAAAADEAVLKALQKGE